MCAKNVHFCKEDFPWLPSSNLLRPLHTARLSTASVLRFSFVVFKRCDFCDFALYDRFRVSSSMYEVKDISMTLGTLNSSEILTRFDLDRFTRAF